jgi:hypothetical protein
MVADSTSESNTSKWYNQHDPNPENICRSWQRLTFVAVVILLDWLEKTPSIVAYFAGMSTFSINATHIIRQIMIQEIIVSTQSAGTQMPRFGTLMTTQLRINHDNHSRHQGVKDWVCPRVASTL